MHVTPPHGRPAATTGIIQLENDEIDRIVTKPLRNTKKKLIYNYYYILYYCVPATRVYSDRRRGSGGQTDKFRSKNPTETRLMAARRFVLQTARTKVAFRIRFADVNSFSNIVMY